MQSGCLRGKPIRHVGLQDMIEYFAVDRVDLIGVSWVLIFFGLIGDRDLTINKEVNCGVLLLLTRSFEGYSSSWDF
jgi:hypothetical protein